MAEASLFVGDIWPIGTTVEVYRTRGWTPSVGGGPPGTALDSTAVTSGGRIVFDDLAREQHVATASVGGVRRFVLFDPQDAETDLDGKVAIIADPEDPYGVLTLDNLTLDTTPPRKRASINFHADREFLWQIGFDVGGGPSEFDNDFVIGYHRWPADPSKSRDVIYMTNEEFPRVGILVNAPGANLSVASVIPERMILDLSQSTAAATQLNGAQNVNAATITVDSTTGFRSSGRMWVDGLAVDYTGKTATTFTGCTSNFSTQAPDNAVVSDAGWLMLARVNDGATPVFGIGPDGSLAIGGGSVQPKYAISLAAGTTTAEGVSFGDDTFLYRTAAGKLATSGELEVDGALNHDGSTVGFFGVTPATRPAAYTASNVTPDRSYDANATTVDELADVLGTLIADLRSLGLVQ